MYRKWRVISASKLHNLHMQFLVLFHGGFKCMHVGMFQFALIVSRMRSSIQTHYKTSAIVHPYHWDKAWWFAFQSSGLAYLGNNWLVLSKYLSLSPRSCMICLRISFQCDKINQYSIVPGVASTISYTHSARIVLCDSRRPISSALLLFSVFRCVESC